MPTLSPEQRRELEEEIEEELADEWEDDGSPSPGAKLLRKFGDVRKRILVVFGTLIGSALVAGYFSQPIFDFLIQPLCAATATSAAPVVPGVAASKVGNCMLYPTSPLEPMMVLFKLSLLIGLFATAPVLFYQVWSIIESYVSAKTKLWAFGFVFGATFFFVGGAAFGFFVVFPPAFNFMLSVGGPNIITLATPTSYFKILSMLLLGFGATFELPLLMFMLARLGVTDYRFYLKYWRHAIFALFVFSAAITPTTDPVTMGLMGGPLAVLYFFGILAAFLGGKRGPTLLEARLKELDEFRDDFEDG